MVTRSSNEKLVHASLSLSDLDLGVALYEGVGRDLEVEGGGTLHGSRLSD
jgi:hypothetical protein